MSATEDAHCTEASLYFQSKPNAHLGRRSSVSQINLNIDLGRVNRQGDTSKLMIGLANLRRESKPNAHLGGRSSVSQINLNIDLGRVNRQGDTSKMMIGLANLRREGRLLSYCSLIFEREKANL